MLGGFVLCLEVEDVERAARFYQALGMTTCALAGGAVRAWNGDLELELTTSAGEHGMSFRGGDPSAVHRDALTPGIGFAGEPQSYRVAREGGDREGTRWLTHDPDGNRVCVETPQAESGEPGRALHLLRILDGTRRQLFDVEAPEPSRQAFESSVIDRFVTAELKGAAQLELTALPKPGEFAGYFSYCLKTKDSHASRDWYRALGFEVGNPSDGPHIRLRASDCRLDLMGFLSENLLNFRGADVFRVYEQLMSADQPCEGQPQRYTKEEFGSPGMHWRTRDPDGHVVYFDTTDSERIEAGDPRVLRRILEHACHRLEQFGADPACAAAIRRDVLDRFAPGV